MKLIDFAEMGFKNLWRRKLRTILTMVGVSIGAFSIVIMLSLGIAMTEGYKNQLAEWGSLTKIEINRYSYVYDEESGMGMSQENTLDDTLVQTLTSMDHVRAVTPILNVSGQLKSGKYQAWVSITGIDPDTLEYFDFPELASGDYISNENPTALLFGQDAVYFYNPKSNNYGYGRNENLVDLMNDTIKITFDDTYGDKVPKYNKIPVAGILAECNNEANYNTYAPIEQVKKWYKEQQESRDNKDRKEFSYQSIWVSVDDTKYVEEVQDKIKELGYSAYSRADELNNVTQMSNTLQLILGGIGAVSLLVSAIGIANTMIMSIYERTKEIGVMKVLGCIVTDIRKLFLFEASIIGLLGGGLGLGLSYLASFLLNKYAPQIGEVLGLNSQYDISIIPLWLALAALVFSILIGIVSGLYPAIKATKIKAIEAMRTEG